MAIIVQPVRTLAFVSLGLVARILISSKLDVSEIRQRVEVTTPVSDWKRVYEAIHLWNTGLDPYSGNIFHEYPISLQFYKLLHNYFNVDLTFAITDIIIAILLQNSVYKQLILTDRTKEAATSTSTKVLLAYLFSPLTILSCVGKTTTIFSNFLIAVISVTLFMKPFRALTCVLCGFLACNNMHYSTLVLPIFLCQEYCSKKRNSNVNSGAKKEQEEYYESYQFFSSLYISFCIFLASVITLLSASYFIMGKSWTFMSSTYLFVLTVQDLTPNIGMFWYFFTEVFPQFLDFFTWIIQINAFVHVVPLAICLRNKPFFALYINIMTATIFQPYPNLANVGLLLSLLIQFNDLFPHMRHGLKICCALITCMSLWPIFWHLWIVMGTANSNFYFGATLAFTLSLILLMVDLLNANSYLESKSRFEKHQKLESDLEKKND